MPSKALADSQRNQTPSPMEQTQRKPAAWARGSTNPVTQRPVGAASANGVTNNPNKSTTPQKASSNASKENSTPDRQAHEKLTFLLAQSQGLGCTITLKNGEKYTGIFSAALTDSSEPPRYLLKMVKKVASDGQANGASDSPAYVGTGPQYQKMFVVRDVVDLQVDGIQITKNQAKSGQNGTSRFRTDADISGGFIARERDLKPWDGGVDSNVDLSLDGGNNSKPWDQFEANERLYGLTTNYDESYYTTTIDKSHPQYKEREAVAERLAREIENSSAMNSHVAEERGLKIQDDPGEDEESKYSGVHRDHTPLSSSQSNKYLPPAMRRPSGPATVPEAPVDPAIISSSLAKNEKVANKGGKENEKPTAIIAPTKTPSPIPAKGQNIDETPKPSTSKPALEKVLPTQTKVSPSSKDGGATATVEKDVVNAFKAFHATEKLRAREQQQQIQRRDKAVKLNDLKKFSQNFKLHTLVPDDLIPILAKEKDKQEEIVAKARKNFEDLKTPPLLPAQKVTEPTPASTSSEQKPPTKPAAVRVASSSATPSATSQPTGPVDRSNQRNANRQSPSGFSQPVRPAENRPNPQIPNMPRNGHTQFGQKLNAQYNRQGPVPMQHLQDPRIAPVPTGPAMPTMPAMPANQPMHGMPNAPPQNRLQYTTKIPEFKPNPAAHTFQPGTNSSGAASPIHANPTPRPKIGNFFEGRRAILPAESRLTVAGSLNTIDRLLEESKDDAAAVINGGIRKMFFPPVWDVPDENKDVKYVEIFEKTLITGSSPPLVLPHHGMGPHGHQMHLSQQGIPMAAGHTPQHTPRHHAVQPHVMSNGPQHDDHRMQFSQSTSSIHPSPRPPPPYVANGYGPGAQPVQMFPQQMGYQMSPGGHPMTMRQVSGGPQFMPPTGPGMGGPVMANQMSSGPYMNPQMQVFSPVPGQAYPHNGHNQQHTPPGGFPSPRPTHMMAHSVSQQGHPQPIVYVGNQAHPPLYGQPPTGPMGPMRGPFQGPPQAHHYGSSPHQHHQFPQQMPRGTPSATYVQPMMPANNHAMPPQMPPTGPAMQAEAPEDVK